MINFILSLIGIAALILFTFTIGLVMGMYVSIEAISNNDKAEMKRFCDVIKVYWDSKKSSTLG